MIDVFICNLAVLGQLDPWTVEDAGPYNARKKASLFPAQAFGVMQSIIFCFPLA